MSGQTFVKPEDSTHVLGFKKTAKPEVSTLYADKIYIASLENLVCSHCQSNYRVEIRHIRFIKGLNPKVSHLDKIIIKANRKQIPLCRSCNMKQHEQDNVKNGEPYELKGSRTVRERGKSIFFWGTSCSSSSIYAIWESTHAYIISKYVHDDKYDEYSSTESNES